MPSSASPLRRSLLLALAGAGLPACTRPTLAAADAPVLHHPTAQRSPAGYRVARFGLDSADGLRRYRVQLAIPMAVPPAAGYPLLVLLDGNAAFDLLTEDMLAPSAASGRPLAIAALGYEADRQGETLARSFDYTPPVPGEDPTWDDEARQRPGGGADTFLDLLERRVLPEIARHAPYDPARSTLWGHSYGGLLALYTVFTRPALFPRYVAADPSLWWHDGFILSVEQRARPLPAQRRTSLLLMAGTTRPAEPTATQASRPEAMRRRAVLQDATPQLAQRQAQRAGMHLTWTPFPGIGHGAMRQASLPATLAFALQ